MTEPGEARQPRVSGAFLFVLGVIALDLLFPALGRFAVALIFGALAFLFPALFALFLWVIFRPAPRRDADLQASIACALALAWLTYMHVFDVARIVAGAGWFFQMVKAALSALPL